MAEAIRIDGRQVHGAGCVVAAADQTIEVSAGGWTFTFAPASTDSVGFATSNDDLREARVELANPPPLHEAAVSDTVTTLGGMLGITLHSTHRAVANGLRLLTYTVINSNAV